MRSSVFCQQAHIAAKGAIDILAVVSNENRKAQNYVTFRNNAPFRSCMFFLFFFFYQNDDNSSVLF